MTRVNVKVFGVDVSCYTRGKNRAAIEASREEPRIDERLLIPWQLSI